VKGAIAAAGLAGEGDQLGAVFDPNTSTGGPLEAPLPPRLAGGEVNRQPVSLHE